MIKNFIQLMMGNGFSKILGLLREILIANFFGTSYIADAYRIAQTIILLPTQLIMGNAFQQAFIPSYKKLMKSNQSEKLFSSIFYVFLFLSGIFTFSLLFFTDYFVNLIAPGFSIDATEFTSQLVTIMALGIPFYIFTYYLIYHLNSFDKFSFNSIAVVMQNLIVIVTILLSTYFLNPLLLGYGFPGAFIITLFLVSYFLMKNMRLSINHFKFSKESMKTLKNFTIILSPLLVYMLLTQLNIFVERIVASKLEVGAIASVDYARTLFETPLFLIGIPLATISLSYYSGRDWSESKIKIENTINLILVIFLPISIFFFIKSELLISLLFERGEFSVDSVLLTSKVLKGLSLGLCAMALSVFLQRVYNAYFRNKEMLVITGISIILNIIFNILFTPHIGVYGIGLAFSICYIFQAILLIMFLKINLKEIIKFLSIMSFLSIGYILLCKFIEFDNPWLHILIISSVSIIYWGMVYLTIPYTRKYIMPIIQKFVKKPNSN